MDPADFSSSSNDYTSPSESPNKKRDFFEMTFDPWTGGGGGSNSVHQSGMEDRNAKKPRLFEEEPLFNKGHTLPYGINKMDERGKGKIFDEDEQDELNDKEADEPTSTSNKPESETELDTSEVLPSSTTGTRVENKIADEPDDDPEQDVSSPTTTPPQSSSEPEQTPRSSVSSYYYYFFELPVGSLHFGILAEDFE